MPDKPNEEYLVVCRGETLSGKHGLYIATYPIDQDLRLMDVEGSITVSLDGFQYIKLIQSGVVVVVGSLVYKEAGWRATILRLATLEDVRFYKTAISIEQKKINPQNEGARA